MPNGQWFTPPARDTVEHGRKDRTPQGAVTPSLTVNAARAASASNTHDPLTTINSYQESTVADADLKASCAHSARTVTIQESRRWRPYSPQRRTNTPPLVPWLKLSGRWLESAGFKPKQRLKVEVQLGRLIITHA